MIMELCEHGNLFDLIAEKKEGLSWPQRLKIARDVANGMNYMHTLQPPIMHLDLKSPNVLISSLHEDDVAMAKVSDFGLSSTAEMQYVRLVNNPVWLAPEIIQGEGYSLSADMYSYGVILFELLSMGSFFSEMDFMSDIELAVASGKRPDLLSLSGFSAFKELIVNCWAQLPKERLAFQEVLTLLIPIVEIAQALKEISKILYACEVLITADETYAHSLG